MLFHHDNRPPERLPTIYLQDHLLNVARKQRHLGIVFQHDLRWAEHINTILNKSLTSLKTFFAYAIPLTPQLSPICTALT